jgi:hypothetical protein
MNVIIQCVASAMLLNNDSSFNLSMRDDCYWQAALPQQKKKQYQSPHSLPINLWIQLIIGSYNVGINDSENEWC